MESIDFSDSNKMDDNHHASGTSVMNDEKLHATSSATAYSSPLRSIDKQDSNGTLMTDITATTDDNADESTITDISKPYQSEAMRCRRLEMNRASAKARRSNQKWLVENLTNEVSELREKLTQSQGRNVELMKSNAHLKHALVLQQQARHQQQNSQHAARAQAQAQALLQGSPDLLSPNACLQQIQRLKLKMHREQQQHGQRELLKQQLMGGVGGNNNNTNTNAAFLGSLLQQREQQQQPSQQHQLQQQQQQQDYQQCTNQQRMYNFVVGDTTTAAGLPITTALKTTEQLLAHNTKSAATSTKATIQPLDIRMLPPPPPIVPLSRSSYSQQQQQNVKMEMQQLPTGALTSLVSSLGTP